LWFKIPLGIQRHAEKKYLHFMGGIHAIEHAAIGIFPLLVMADRNDLGGISTPFHPQVEGAAVFIFDGVPGGAGLSRYAFERAEKLLESTLGAISACPCESGCPSCVHSPKCGSGNRPIDKAAAKFILEKIITGDKGKSGGQKRSETNAKALHKKRTVEANPDKRKAKKTQHNTHFGVIDIETQRSAQEVGGWNRADLMGISCVVLYDSRHDKYFEFLEDQVPLLIHHLKKFDLVIGFNIKRFDFRVLSGYSDFHFRKLPTLDILEAVHDRLGYRLSLDHLAKVTLGKEKTADGLQALRWWKQGRIREIIDYCKVDVEITKDLFLYGKNNGYLLFKNKAKKTVRVPVNW
jgi:DEAD/DEAH box helicase domain-containing protein